MRRGSAKKDMRCSEIFLRYVAPLSADAPKDISPEKLQHVFRFPTAVWNAVVLKQWGNPTDYIQEIVSNLVQSGDPQEMRIGEAMVRMWVQRKEELFPDEHWAIEDVVVYRDFSGETMVRVLARAPEEFAHQLPTQKRADDHRSTLN